jgi:hypothetical protein
MTTVKDIVFEANFSFAKWDADEKYIVAFRKVLKGLPGKKVNLSFIGKEGIYSKGKAMSKDKAVELLCDMEKHYQHISNK